MPDELLTLLAAMTPLGELRLSIPLGILKLDIAWPLVLALSVVGNLLPVPFLLGALHVPAARGLMAIATGVVIAGAVVTAATLAGIELVRIL